MSTFDLPPTPPLPAEVRERVLRTVDAGTGGLGAGPIAVAVVVLLAVLAVMSSVALTVDVAGIDPLARPAPTSLPTSPPPTTVTLNLP
ncbi:hypothetical protein [Pseudonocardia cypriaca]|uniref:Uncharacterized protein n=1 Tax=Pseudonocardia cypriaca TaxID=882449 RepID=A0A543FVJ1_9PSEU|nr:hypothetical protein [Pseudonocardia cypriaca]TQM37832.1 hypothetical protein FB388_5051 [Pseudonocardia cypriaca]